MGVTNNEVPAAFTPEGVLPPGDYPLTLDELAHSMLVVGPRPRPREWNAPWRRQLVVNLGILVDQLWQVGITEIYVDGSFVENKGRPGDIDGYFHCTRQDWESGLLHARLNLLDPSGVWRWDTRPLDPRTRTPHIPMWHQYHVELFGHWGALCGIRDAQRHELEFPAAFRLSRAYQPKGIIKIVR